MRPNRKDDHAKRLLRRLAREEGVELWTGAMQRAEVVFFMRPHEQELTLSVLSRFRTQSVTQENVDRAGTIYRQWNRSHGTGVNDALLAASALASGGRIYTQNIKHYPMPGLDVVAGWKA